MLGWLGLLFADGAHHRNEGNVDEGDVFTTDTELELAKGLNIGC